MKVAPLKTVADLFVSNVDKKSYDGETAVRLCNYTDVYYNASISSELPFMSATATSQQIAKFALRAGDTLFTKDSETAADIAVPAFVPVDLPGVVCGYHLAMARPTKVDPRFLYWSMASSGVREQMAVAATGVTRFGIRQDLMGQVGLSLPPPSAQKAIADFLDAETARIDSLVDRERLLVELSEERLAALTLRVLLPAASILSQDSGAELPSEWQSFRLKMLLREVTDLSTEGSEELLSVSHITGVTPRSEKRVTMTMAESLEGYKRVAVNDFVVNTLWAWMGAVGVSKHSGIVSPAYGVYRHFSPRIEPRYLDYFARTRPFIDLMTQYSKGVWSSRLRLYADELLGLRVALPPSAEQLRVVAVLDREARRAESMRRLVGRSIELLTERKQALITAAVTGQLDLAREIAEETS